MSPLNLSGQNLAQNLSRLKEENTAHQQSTRQAQKVNVVGAGGAITAAYEQLRNAAENTEEHLLLQNAIKRFYKQLFVIRDEALLRDSGHELTVELTLAGYIPNDHLTASQLQSISKIAWQFYGAYEQLLQDKTLSTKKVYQLTVDVMSVDIESIINDHGLDSVFVDYSYTQLEAMIDEEKTFGRLLNDEFGAALYVAIHQALLKADVAVIRAGLLQRYQVDPGNLNQYKAVNAKIDRLIDSESVDKLRRIVDRQGAPLRILRRLMEDEPDLGRLLENKSVFLSRYEQQIVTEYKRTSERINKAIIRSVIFLIITKVLIGIAIEVPYDYLVYGQIIWLPLIINLLFPPIYMIMLRATHQLPGRANTTVLVDRMEQMAYGSVPKLSAKRLRAKSYNAVFSAMYVISGLAIFAGVTYLLIQLSFSLVHIVIFFVFLSAASFLGFRLSRYIRELEIVQSAQNGFTFLRDLLYLPFVVVGQWMSDKYSRVNIVTMFLDMLIELPLKTILRLLRQWNAFIDDRKDRI